MAFTTSRKVAEKSGFSCLEKKESEIREGRGEEKRGGEKRGGEKKGGEKRGGEKREGGTRRKADLKCFDQLIIPALLFSSSFAIRVK